MRLAPGCRFFQGSAVHAITGGPGLTGTRIAPIVFKGITDRAFWRLRAVHFCCGAWLVVSVE